SLESVDCMDDAAWDGWAKTIDATSPATKAARVFPKIRTRDMPRVSPWQLDVLRALLLQLDKKSGGKITKIVTLHHHLSPVSDLEENKSFESVANLGRLRSFLRHNRVNLVLHGHKHTPHAYREVVHPFSKNANATTHGVLVISGGTIGMGAP